MRVNFIRTKFAPKLIRPNLSQIKFKYFASNFQPNLQKLPYKKEINLLNFTKFAQNIDFKKAFG